MSDALTAAAGLFTWIPTKARQALYGLFGLAILLEAILDVLDESVDLKVMALWGLFNSLMALANSSTTPLPPPPPNGGVEPRFPDEFA